ncbi:hypothetical protein PVAND_008565 [Polypedilum vanderplanki]|uniref:EamA domain-containing protein n=1 Tax=Polypedilum vanderplanki TaxID=319348 RepID=A0A9J6CA60_POLVA|nr:hypothetical protein PVAND_008565 [Polypedilum vanderplanki]
MAVKSHQFLGIILSIASSLCFSLCSVIAKYLVEISAVELTLFRFFGIFFPSLSFAIYKNENIFPERNFDRTILFLRCFIGTTGLMLNFYAVQNMNLGDSSVIIYSTPVFVAIFSKIFLNEKCTLFNIFNILLTMIGIIFIVRPTIFFGISSTSSNSMWGIWAAILSAICGSNVIVLLRILKHIDSNVIMSSSGFFAIIYTYIVLIFLNEYCAPCGLKEKFLILLLAIFSYTGQYFLTTSLKYEEPNIISISRSTIILFSFVWQILFFQEVPTFSSLIGSIIIIISVGLLAFKKYVLSTKEPIIISNRLLRLLQF